MIFRHSVVIVLSLYGWLAGCTPVTENLGERVQDNARLDVGLNGIPLLRVMNANFVRSPVSCAPSMFYRAQDGSIHKCEELKDAEGMPAGYSAGEVPLLSPVPVHIFPPWPQPIISGSFADSRNPAPQQQVDIRLTDGNVDASSRTKPIKHHGGHEFGSVILPIHEPFYIEPGHPIYAQHHGHKPHVHKHKKLDLKAVHAVLKKHHEAKKKIILTKLVGHIQKKIAHKLSHKLSHKPCNEHNSIVHIKDGNIIPVHETSQRNDAEKIIDNPITPAASHQLENNPQRGMDEPGSKVLQGSAGALIANRATPPPSISRMTTVFRSEEGNQAASSEPISQGTGNFYKQEDKNESFHSSTDIRAVGNTSPPQAAPIEREYDTDEYLYTTEYPGDVEVHEYDTKGYLITTERPEEGKILEQGPDVVDSDFVPKEEDGYIRIKRESPSIPIEILQDQPRSATILDRSTLIEIMSALKEQYLKNAEPDQRKLIEDAFDRLHCSVQSMKKLDERPSTKNLEGPKKATLELLAERAQPLIDESDYYNDGTEDTSGDLTLLDLLNVADKHKEKLNVEDELPE